MVGYSSPAPGVTTPLKSAKPLSSHGTTKSVSPKQGQNLNSQNFSSPRSNTKPKSAGNKNARMVSYQNSSSPRPNLHKQSSSPRPLLNYRAPTSSPRPLLNGYSSSSPRTVPAPRTRHPSSSASSVSSMSTSPSPRNSPNSFRSSPSRFSPNSFASSTCYQAPIPSALPLPPLHWTGGCSTPVQDPTTHLKFLLNVQA